jgi:starvation-inducible DNA-binding protein
MATKSQSGAAARLDVLDSRAETEPLNTGISNEDRKKLAKDISSILADTYMLVIKSHVYHWNVSGPIFRSLHLLTEEHYDDLFKAADELAERIRALGFQAPVEKQNILEISSVKFPLVSPTAREMVEDLVRDHESIVRKMRDCAEDAEEKRDFVTHDMLTGRLAFHEKAVWMLRAIDG